MYMIKAYQRGIVNDIIEVSGSEAAWDKYQFYRMVFPKANVAMIDNRTGELIATNEGGM